MMRVREFNAPSIMQPRQRTSAKRRFSPLVVNALVDLIAGGGRDDQMLPIGLYRSGPAIELFFLDCGLDMRVGPSSRVPATTAFLRSTANRPDGDQLLERIIEKVCDPREYLSVPDKAEPVRDYLNHALAPGGLAVVVTNGTARLTERSATGASVERFMDKITVLNDHTVQIEVARALVNLDDDPEDAATAAYSLVEAVSRSILMELGHPLPPKKDVEGLLKPVRELLDLAPGRSGSPVEAGPDVCRVLDGLTSVMQGIGASRTLGGEAQEREKGNRRVDVRFARLALNCASSLAVFLIETWESKEQRSLPLHADP